ncbi:MULTISPECIES: hypothetical protein [unclassified Pseudomonas]|uniref:hypothetical protein n=1 Tax=unclassified Pseudomonas TaxID=196821 RepID=UPI000A1FF63A|nr:MULTISPECIES: hypothetical protein [unclassified Pseudomonas]
MTKETYSLWLVGGTALLVADTALPGQQYVLDSLLFAQLRADKLNGSRFSHYARWYSGYRSVMEARGWVFTRSGSDYQRLAEGAQLTPTLLLKEKLQARHPRLCGYLQAAIAKLSQDQVQQHLRPFTVAENEKACALVLELGVLLPDASMTLCGLAVDSEQADGVDLRESVVVLGDSVTQDVRQHLHALLEKKDKARHIRNLGPLIAEADHGHA